MTKSNTRDNFIASAQLLESHIGDEISITHDDWQSEIKTLPDEVWAEMAQSAINPGITRLNVEWLDGDLPIERLCDHAIELLAAGKETAHSQQHYTKAVTNITNQYKHCIAGGWWAAGVDPLNNWEPMPWGCFKPTTSRLKMKEVSVPNSKKKQWVQTDKPVKYEHPYKVSMRAFFPRVDETTWKKISDSLGVPIGAYTSFWHWVAANPQIPIYITEGWKKAASLLSAGVVAIGLPGIDGGSRKNKNDGLKQIIPELEWIRDRQVYICFDNDSKPVTRQNTLNAAKSLGWLLVKRGCKVSRLVWDRYPQKGIDDLIVAHGKSILFKLQTAGLSPKYDSLRTADKKLNSRYLPSEISEYLGDVSALDNGQFSTKLVAIKSPKGSGKTEVFGNISRQLHLLGYMSVFISHRVELSKALAKRCGVKYIDDSVTCDRGFSMVIDSCHPDGKQGGIDIENDTRFTTRKYIVFLDEVEQLIWHMLSADTDVKRHRTAVLQQFEQLLKNADIVVIADADLTNVGLNYIEKLIYGDGQRQSTLIVNSYAEMGYDCEVYEDKSPSRILRDLVEDAASKKLIIATDSQKLPGVTSTKAIEALLRGYYPDKKILRIDSESLADPLNDGYAAIARDINSIVSGYDILIYSPSMGTGVSIDIRGHFDCCYGIFKGVQSSASARQMLYRLRDPIPRKVWVRTIGNGIVGGGEVYKGELLSRLDRQVNNQIRELLTLSQDDDIEALPAVNSTHLDCYGLMGCRINSDRWEHRDDFVSGLRNEGVRVSFSCGDDKDPFIKDEVKPLAKELDKAECTVVAIVAIDDLLADPVKADRLLARKEKDRDDRARSHKLTLTRMYPGVEVTPEMVAVTSQHGYFKAISLHYFLTRPEALLARDLERFKAYKKNHKNQFLPDLTKTTLSARVKVLKFIGIEELMHTDRLNPQSPIISRINELATQSQYKQNIQDHVGKWAESKPLSLARKMLKLIGWELTDGKKVRDGDKTFWEYSPAPTDEIRYDIFNKWDAIPAPAPAPEPTPEPIQAPAPAIAIAPHTKVRGMGIGAMGGREDWGIWEVIETLGNLIKCRQWNEKLKEFTCYLFCPENLTLVPE